MRQDAVSSLFDEIGAHQSGSGGVNFYTVRTIAEAGVDRISIGALTKDVRATDYSMRIVWRARLVRRCWRAVGHTLRLRTRSGDSTVGSAFGNVAGQSRL